MYKNLQGRNVQEMQRSIVKHCTPRSQIMWNVTLNSSYTSSYIINVDQNKKRKQSTRMRRRDCNLPLTINTGECHQVGCQSKMGQAMQDVVKLLIQTLGGTDWEICHYWGCEVSSITLTS